MPKYIVRETFTALYHVEAESEAAAIEKAKENSPRDFDEIDCSPRGANTISAEIDPDQD